MRREKGRWEEIGGRVCVCACVSVCMRQRRGVFVRAAIRWREHQHWCPIHCYFCSTLLSLGSITAAAIIFTKVCVCLCACMCVCKLIRSEKMRDGGKENREEWSCSSSSTDKIQATHTAPVEMVCVCVLVCVCVYVMFSSVKLLIIWCVHLLHVSLLCVCVCVCVSVCVSVCDSLQLHASCWNQSRNHMCE